MPKSTNESGHINAPGTYGAIFCSIIQAYSCWLKICICPSSPQTDVHHLTDLSNDDWTVNETQKCCVLYGVPQLYTVRCYIDSLVQRLPSCSNAVERLASGTRRCEHITPVSRRLHRLPVRQRTEFKMAVLVYTPEQGTERLATTVPGGLLRTHRNRWPLATSIPMV